MGTVKIEDCGNEIRVRTLSLDYGSRIEESSSICYCLAEWWAWIK
jgi:hypothetical protein